MSAMIPYRSPGLPAQLPFCSAVRVGDVIWCSGSIGNKPGLMEVVEGGAAAETRQAILHIRETLEAMGSGLDKVIKCTLFLADMADYAAVNAVYAEHFPGQRTARSAFAVAGLACNARIELEAVAVA